jgi:hypothetical protein
MLLMTAQSKVLWITVYTPPLVRECWSAKRRMTACWPIVPGLRMRLPLKVSCSTTQEKED